MLLVRGLFFLGGRPGVDPARAPGIAHVLYRDVSDHVARVDIAHVDVGDVGDAAVVIELVVAPVTPLQAAPEVAEAVVHATVEAHDRSPVAGIPQVQAVGPPPVTGRPQQSRLGRFDPGAGHPEVALRTISPVTGRPQQSRCRNLGLFVDRQRRWCYLDLNADLRLPRRRYQEYGGGEGGDRDVSEGTQHPRTHETVHGENGGTVKACHPLALHASACRRGATQFLTSARQGTPREAAVSDRHRQHYAGLTVTRHAAALLTALVLGACHGGTTAPPAATPPTAALLPLQGPDGRYGYINASGALVIAPQFAEAFAFRDDLAAVAVGDILHRKYGFIGRDGKFVVAPQFDGAGSLSEGLASVTLAHLSGF